MTKTQRAVAKLVDLDRASRVSLFAGDTLFRSSARREGHEPLPELDEHSRSVDICAYIHRRIIEDRDRVTGAASL